MFSPQQLNSFVQATEDSQKGWNHSSPYPMYYAIDFYDHDDACWQRFLAHEDRNVEQAHAACAKNHVDTLPHAKPNALLLILTPCLYLNNIYAIQIYNQMNTVQIE
jgi:hypothetical protein